MAKTTITSPKGVAVFPHLNTPDTKFNEAGVYTCKLRLEGPAAEAFAAKLDELHAQAVKNAQEETGKKKVKVSSLPYTEDEENEGAILVNFKMKASGISKKTGEKWTRRPMLYDATLQPCPDARVGGGSVVRVAFDPFLYYTAAIGAGVSLRLEAVQILDLKEWGGASATSFGFDEEEGFSAPAAPANAFADEAEEEDDEDGDGESYDF